ncbi:LPXTG cell wall anchor domain-containing protein, partial [Limosilactobacillus difficilis]|uniref:LPXTG cell wall anchor domain-containing protein n=1 Tax=Limosilactobacillus difficilis TaxID=2991838 RepID=UPI0024B8E5AF
KTSTPKVPTPQPSNPTVTTPKTSTPAVPTPQPSNPAVPTPPTTPVDPTTPDMPNTNTPKTPIVPSVLENKEQRKVNLTPGTSAVFETSNSGLPKTGSVQSKLSQITGLLLLAILATFGLYKKRV